NRRHEGLGLGLSVAEAVMRQHGGSLELHSVPGKCTNATLRFPPVRLVWPSLKEAKTNAPAPLPLADFKAPLILVVEDDEDLRELLRRMLERSGFSTAGASDGH